MNEQTTERPTFAVGDVVKLKRLNGWEMLVTHVGDVTGRLECFWFSSYGEGQSFTFPPELVTLVQRRVPQPTPEATPGSHLRTGPAGG